MEVAKVSENERCDDAPRFPLNYDCMYEVFKRLSSLDECMSLAESCEGLQCVADWIYRTRYMDISIDFFRPLDIDRIMNHIGPFIKSLVLMLFYKAEYTAENLVRIQQSCKQLKSLTIVDFDRSVFKTDPFSDHFSEKLESLMLTSCSLGNDKQFFKSFTIRKSLTMINCFNISYIAMQNCFAKNQQIESFACNSRSLEYGEFLDLLPNLKRLTLAYEVRVSKPCVLSRLKSLRSLSLHCGNRNVNEVLSRVSIDVKRNLEELDLTKVVPNAKTFELLAEFVELRRLIITTTRDYKLLPTDKLPLKLKTLKLRGFHVSKQRLLLLIEQQKQIENIHLADCVSARMNVFRPMAQLIAQKCNAEDRKIHLTVTVSNDLPSKGVIRLGNFLITGYVTHPDDFKIIVEE